MENKNKMYFFAIAIIMVIVVIGVYVVTSSTTGALVREGDEFEEVDYYCCGGSQDALECSNANWRSSETCANENIGGRSYYNIFASCCIGIQSCEHLCSSNGYEKATLSAADERDPLTYCTCSGYV